MNKKILLGLAGFALIILGVALSLHDWVSIVTVFRGLLGPIIAVGGLILLATLKH